MLGGQYLNSNPQTEAMVHQGEQDAGNAINSTFSQYGRTGGGNNVSNLARGVAQAGDAIRFGQYNTERQNQQQVASMLPSLYAAQFAGVPAYLGAANAAATTPYSGLGALSGMGNLWAGQGTTTGTQPGGWGTALLGAGAQIASGFAAASDRRLKTKIELLHRDPDGLGWYRFAYKRAPDEMLVGVMADEVRELRPRAYIKGFVNGEYDGVNYAALKEAA